MRTVTILDYGMGNLHSVLKKFRPQPFDPRTHRDYPNDEKKLKFVYEVYRGHFRG